MSKLLDEESIIPTYVRRKFYIKVYSLVATQTAVTTSIVALCMFPLRAFMQTEHGVTVSLVGSVSALLLVCTLTCARQRFPYNLLMLMGIALTEGFAIGPMCAVVNNAPLILASFGACSFVFIVMTGVTIVFKVPANELSLCIPLSCLAAASTLMLTVTLLPHTLLLPTMVSMLGIVAFSAFVVNDTAALATQYGPDDAIDAALQLYLDLLNLFLCFVQASR